MKTLRKLDLESMREASQVNEKMKEAFFEIHYKLQNCLNFAPNPLKGKFEKIDVAN